MMSQVMLEVWMKSHLIEKLGQASHFFMSWRWDRSHHKRLATMNLDFFIELSEIDLGRSLGLLTDFDQSLGQQVEAELGLFLHYQKSVQSCELSTITSCSFKSRLQEVITTMTGLSSTLLNFNYFLSQDLMSLHFPHSLFFSMPLQ